MAVNVKKHSDTMIDFGDKHRIERRYAAVKPVPRMGKDGKPLKTLAGNPITDAIPHTELNWVAYKLTDCRPRLDDTGKPVEGQYIHPWHGEPTNMKAVWMPLGDGTEAEARALVEKDLGSKLPVEKDEPKAATK